MTRDGARAQVCLIPRSRRPVATALIGVAVATLLSAGAAAGVLRKPSDHTITGTATARLSPKSVEGSRLIEEGPVSGALKGSSRAELHVGAKLTAKFTIRTRDGSITGNGKATPHGSGRFQSFAGSMTVASGTGLYKHAHGYAGLYGVFDRRTEKVTIQATGGHVAY